MLTIIIEDDKILRSLQVILGSNVSDERIHAYCDYLSVDISDPRSWIEQQRKKAASILPLNIKLVESADTMRAMIPNAHAIITESFSVGGKEIDIGGELRLIQKFGTDTRNIDIQACRRAGVLVRTLRRRVNGVVAEHAILLMLAVGRKLIETNGALDLSSLRSLGYKPKQFDANHVSGANWARIDGLRSLSGATVGALGLGEVGREVAIRAKAMGATVIYYQRSRLCEKLERKYGATYTSYEELLKSSDFISLHLPLSDQTVSMVDDRSFELMKPGAILTNISRAHIIDRDALIKALKNGNLGGAGLDVHYEEPANNTDDPLKSFKNVVLSPHIAVADRSHNMADTAQLIDILVEVFGA